MLYAIWKRVIAVVFWRKRRQRKAELRHNITAIRDADGCVPALELYKQCCHISEHYLIPLSKVGFIGSLEDLYVEVGKSLDRANQREDRIMATVPRPD